MKSTFFLLSTFASLSAFADCNSDYCYNVSVSKLYVKTNGIVYVGTSGDESVLACGAVSNVYVTLNMSDRSADAVYAALLAAQASGRPVLLQVDDNISGCPIQYMTLDE